MSKTLKDRNSGRGRIQDMKMIDLPKLPEKISDKIAGLSWNYDDIGMSGSKVMLFDEMALK